MMTKHIKWFCRQSGKSKYTEKDIAVMKATADLKTADRNEANLWCSTQLKLNELKI